MGNENNGFKLSVAEWRGEVTRALKDIREKIKEGQERSMKFEDEIRSELKDIRSRITKLEVSFAVKGGVWGLLGGLIPALVAFIYWIVRR